MIVPQQIIDIVDRDAGKEHSRQGPVVTSLERVLICFLELLITQQYAPALQVHVKIECGHEWIERRSKGSVLPRNGEKRACGNMEHYPAQYRATYSEIKVLEK